MRSKPWAASRNGDYVLATGKDLGCAWRVSDVAPTMTFRLPLFSPRGEMVLVGDGVFSTADGVRRFSLDPTGRLAADGWMELAPDGSRGVSYGFGRRATLFDVEAKGVSAVLGPPVLPDPARSSRGASDLAISRDGTLLFYNIVGSAAFGIRPAPSFSDSEVIWDMRVELNLSVDVSSSAMTEGATSTVQRHAARVMRRERSIRCRPAGRGRVEKLPMRLPPWRIT